MKSKIIVTIVGLLSGIGLLAYAGDDKINTVVGSENTKVISVSINKEGENPAKVDLDIDGEKMSFDLPDLGEGETREITTNDGKIIKVIKAKHGSTIVVDGEKIKLHRLDGKQGMSANIFAFKSMDDLDENSLMISGAKLNDETRQVIKQALLDAGIDKKVEFMDMSAHNWISADDDDLKVILDTDGQTTGDHVIKIEKRIEIHEDSDD